MRLKQVLVATGTLSVLLSFSLTSPIGASTARAAGHTTTSIDPPQSVSLGTVEKFASNTVTGLGRPAELSTEDLKEIKNLARDSGQSETYLLERERGWEAFNKFTSHVKSRYAEAFVEAGYDQSDPRTVWIRLTGKPGEDLTQAAADLPYNVRFEWNSRYNDAELATLAARVGQVVATVGVNYLRVAPDPATNQIVVDANFKTDASESLARAAESVRASLGATDTPAVLISSNPKLTLSNELGAIGGAKLNYNDGSGGYCTAGFGVRKGSDTGLATAAHCNNGLGYNGATGIIQFVEEGATWNGGMVDIQWHRMINGNTVSSTFISDRSGGYNIPSTVDYGSNADIGARVCHFGQTTGYQRCSTVSARNVCLFFSDWGYYCGMTETASNVSLGGDSGGPWFTNRVARGIHKGSSSDHSYYTPQTQLGEGYGLSLITS